jgi:hypothetical protein
VLQSRLNSRVRHLETLVDAAQLMNGADMTPFAEAARDMTNADAALLYATTGDGGLEVVATSGAPAALVGLRERWDVGQLRRVTADAQTWTLSDVDARSFMPSMHSGLVVPIRTVRERPRGLMVVLAASRKPFTAADTAALLRLAPLLWLAVGSMQMTRQDDSHDERALMADERAGLEASR